MTNGPIEFLGESADRSVGRTEYGGDDGLIQPGPDQVGLKARADGMDIGHELSASEVNAAMGRAARVPLVGKEQTTGVSSTGEIVVDPVTGREVPSDVSTNVTGKKGREIGLADGMIQ